MLYKKSFLTRIGACLFIYFFFCSAIALAQSEILVSRERLDAWFFDRFIIGSLLASVAGFFFGWKRLSKIKYVPKNLHVNGQASKDLFRGVAIFGVISLIALLIDAWQLFPFGDVSLSLFEAITQVLFGFRTLVILLAVCLSFTAFALVGTRVAPGSHCPYLWFYVLKRGHM